MKTIKTLIIIISLCLITLTIYVKFDLINSFIKNLFNIQNKLIIKPTNEYTRNYSYLKFSTDEDFIPENRNDIINIFFNILNNGWNDFIFYCPVEYERCQNDIEEITSDKILMSNISSYIHPYNLFYIINTTISSNNEIYVKISKKYTEKEIIESNNKINEIITLLDLENKPNEEKIKLFHDYLIKNTLYDEDFLSTNFDNNRASKSTGALVDGYAVCAGYTDSMAIFLDKLKIPNISVSSETHTWNLVYLNNSWLHVDATWNDVENPRYEYKFYLIDTKELYSYDTTKHIFDKSFFIEAN